MNRDSILGLAPRKIAEILGLTLGPERKDQPSDGSDVADLLEKCLCAKVQVEGAEMLSWDSLQQQSIDCDAKSEGQELGDLLTSSKSDMKVIKAIRKCAKQEAVRGTVDPEHSVATTIYFAAIANGLLFHGAKITTYSYESLQASFDKLGSKPWMSAELRKLFSKALRLCKHRK
jgi:hypothetical protein